MAVGLGTGDIVLDGDPASLKRAQPPVFGPCLLWPNFVSGIAVFVHKGR